MGKVNMYNGTPSFNAYQIRGCDSYNDVIAHYMSVNIPYLEWVSSQKNGGSLPAGVAAGTAQATTTSGTRGGGADFGSGGNDVPNGMTPQQEEVYILITKAQGQNENGADLREIAKQLGRDISADVDELINEGNIYDTVDSNWVKSTSA